MVSEAAHVFIIGRNQHAVDDADTLTGKSVTGIRSDATRQDDLDALAETIRAYGKGLDVVFANAGGDEFGALGQVTVEHLTDTFARNVEPCEIP
jgi:NAD(P)-dependent dehydrogenase (short-subunit alcohol dehydrogenase family)